MDTTLIQVVNAFPQSLVQCIGDMILDIYMYGKTDRISPEAPVPVVNITNTQTMLGGLGNVVNNLNALKVKCEAHTVLGMDMPSYDVQKLLAELKYCTDRSIRQNINTTVKKRVISGGQQLIRIDEDIQISREASEELVESYIEHISSETLDLYLSKIEQLHQYINNNGDDSPEAEKIRDEISKIKPITQNELLRARWYSQSLYADEPCPTQVTIISDYGKGTLRPNTIQKIISNSKPGLIIVDPKGDNYAKYSGAYCITPNRAELKLASRMPVDTHYDIINAAKTIIARTGINNILVTLSEEGMLLIRGIRDKSFISDYETHHIPAQAKQVYDVSGAGDTVIAVLAAALSTGAHILDAAKLANIAAGIVVGKRGTATVTIEELINELTHGSQILTQENTQRLVQQLRKNGATIGFANGCFDILHQGHVELLKSAASKVDHLIIALNSDESVKRLKGESRPIYNQHQRAFILSELKCVTAVTIFEEDTPIELIKQLRPDVIFKGSEYQQDKVIGYDFIKSYGGRVEIIPLIPGISTTNTISKISEAQ